MALFAFVVLVPSARGVYYAFTDWDGLAVALVVAFPVCVLVNLAVRAPSDTSSPIRPTTSPTFELAISRLVWDSGRRESADSLLREVDGQDGHDGSKPVCCTARTGPRYGWAGTW